MKNKIINYELLEEPVKKVEYVLEDYDQEESEMILRYVLQRRAKKKIEFANKEQSRSLISSLPKDIRDIMQGNKEDDE